MGFDYTDAVFKITVTAIEVEQEHGENIIVPYTGIDHAVLNALANRANNETGKCWPGYGLLAKDTHFSRRAVMRAVAKLELIRFITTELTEERSTNTYTLHMAALVAASVAPPTKKAKRQFIRSPKSGVTYKREVSSEELNFLDESETTSFNIEDDEELS